MAYVLAATRGLVCSSLVALLLAGGPARAAPLRPGPGVWPVGGPSSVVRHFDPPAQRWSAGHRGVDLIAPPGTAVRAAAAGSVAFAGPVAGRGVVVVSHADGTRTTYEPVVPAVAVGDPVLAGDPLGRLATGAGHCLPAACLHWGLRRDEVYLDPLLLVRAGPVRLLPVWSQPRRPGTAAPGGTPAGTPGDAPTSDPGWRLAGTAGVPALAGVAALIARRRRAQSSAGSSAASRA